MVRFYLEKVISQFTPVYGLYPLWRLTLRKSIKSFIFRKINLEIVTVPKMNYIAVRGKGDPTRRAVISRLLEFYMQSRIHYG